jgi:ATP-dependent helicase/nuclease subunit A
VSDRDARLDAVQPHRSVIVQAPAGSGKTTLLVERYLALLAVAEAPEEILAITFTRKAAAEMKHRVLRYLDPAFESAEPHEQDAVAKARAVGAKVAEWGLRENPQRLLIRTIDSFNHYLARTMPVASALGPVPAPADHTRALYRKAARQVLALADGTDPLARHLECLLDWRDHRSQDIENLLAGLLARREQWQRALFVTGGVEREHLEAVLEELVCSQLERAAADLDQALDTSGFGRDELFELLCFAAGILTRDGRVSPTCCFADADALPDGTAESLPRWAGMVEALLTRQGKPRKKVTIANGFPPQTAEKERFQTLLDSIADNDRLAAALDTARGLPDPRYSDGEWAVLDALVHVLERAAAELQLVFARTGHTDFTGLAGAALRGLGDEEAGYTDLGLYLDHRIRHILVDEFQDTNWGQLRLLEKLTAGWQSDDRTLFLVGDPMQSIYRFREADVGLFIRTRDFGIGALRPESRRLSRNFRSRSEIVEWVNDKLGPVFPTTENISAGAVAYAASEAGRSAGGRVQILAHGSHACEAEALAELIAERIAANATNAGFKAAIIVRARGHLRNILPALNRRAIRYRAVKLDPLTSRPVVQDLLALTRAILHPTDTAALLAVLRSPVCGLTLADLYALAGDGRVAVEPGALARLDADARERAGRVFAVLADAQRHWRRRPLRDLVEGAWQRLGGPACCEHPASGAKDTVAYLHALDQAEGDGQLDDWNDFREMLDGQFTEGDPASDDVKLEILTMHGAKGLEWDLVVLPGLDRRSGGNDGSLLHWLPFTGERGGERGDERGGEQVLLAPLRAADEDTDSPLVQLIANEQKIRAGFEHQRLLYVATTRAKEHLVLSACLQPRDDGTIRPTSGSLLADLWPTCEVDFCAAFGSAPTTVNGATDAPASAPPAQALRRVAAGWQPPIGERFDWKPALPARDRQIDVAFNWAGVAARRAGTVLHRLLEHVGRSGIENLDDQQRQRLIGRIPALLRALGSREDGLDSTIDVIRAAFEQTLDSDTGRWLLSNRHAEAACELPLAGVLDGQLVNAVVDRTFVDADGVRWIIDYKSGYHAGSDLDAFFDQEGERYRVQLDTYRRLFEQLGATRVKTALYLPRHDRLVGAAR